MLADNYTPITTFATDFTIADHFGPAAIEETYENAFEYAKTDHEVLTELVLVLNHKIWQWYGTNDSIARLYDKLWRTADGWAIENLSGDELSYFIKTLD